jgi:hypothetical protein
MMMRCWRDGAHEPLPSASNVHRVNKGVGTHHHAKRYGSTSAIAKTQRSSKKDGLESQDAGTPLQDAGSRDQSRRCSPSPAGKNRGMRSRGAAAVMVAPASWYCSL